MNKTQMTHVSENFSHAQKTKLNKENVQKINLLYLRNWSSRTRKLVSQFTITVSYRQIDEHMSEKFREKGNSSREKVFRERIFITNETRL